MDQSANIAKASMNTPTIYDDMDYQRRCLMDLFESLNEDMDRSLTELTALLRSQHPEYLPPVGNEIASTSPVVLIRFDEKKEPLFEFRLGNPSVVITGVDIHVAFYSKGIYKILKKALDGEEEEEANGQRASVTQASENEEGSSAENESSVEQSDVSANSNNSASFDLSPTFESLQSAPPSPSDSSNVQSSDLDVPIKEEPIPSGNNIKQIIAKHSGNIQSSKRKSNDSAHLSSTPLPNKRQCTLTSCSRCSSISNSTTTCTHPNQPSTSSSNQPLENVTCMSYEEAFDLALSANPSTRKNAVICPICKKPKNCGYILEHINVIHFGKKPWHCKWPGCNYEGGKAFNAYKHVKNIHLDPIKSTESSKKYIEFVEYID